VFRTIQQFDDYFTAPVHGYRDAEEYWARASARQFLSQITVPTLVLNAQDDPLLAPTAFPHAEAEANSQLFLEAPATGGHVGFIDLQRGIAPWFEQRVVEFLKTHVST
jgi:predicted alpha/beta-fold hydrolase